MAEPDHSVPPMMIPAYIDEAGARGKIRDLTSSQDANFGLLCSLVFYPHTHAEALESFREPFERFCAAAPAGAKLHITDAFALGNEAWRDVAERVRHDYLELIRMWRPQVIYAARRLGVVRNSYEAIEQTKSVAEAARRSPIKIVGANRPSDERVEDQLITNLALRLDGFTELAKDGQPDFHGVELLFDEIDVADRYEAAIERTRRISGGTTVVHGWDPAVRQKVQGEVVTTVAAPFRLNTKYLGQIAVIGKRHPLVLAADIVTNHLAHHLRQLGPTAPLNAPSSVVGWALQDRVYGVQDGSLDDLI